MLEAREHFEEKGFKFVDVPWCVSWDAIMMTRPPHIQGEPFHFWAGGNKQYPVASAEQSFLEMQLEATNKGKPITGSYCAITPCFRNEPKLDDLHQPYFMKCELISWVPIDGKLIEQEIQMHRMIDDARKLFEAEGLEVECVPNPEGLHDPIAVEGQAFDIISFRGNVEVGSYGIRQHPQVGRWIYGTGIAEPRFSYALEVEETFKKAAGQPA
jgi:seryl-tRNA synthetase